MLYFYNTLGRRKQEFTPIDDKKVKIYYCGPTVYWTQHIGNLRGAFCADIVVRALKYLGFQTKFVRNYTDVGHLTSDADAGEDKMEKAVKRDQLDPTAIAQKYIEIYEKDTAQLNLLEPDFKPRATETIAEMIEMTQILIDKGFAYETDLAVYFNVAKFSEYTALSGQILEENKEGAGHGDAVDQNKKNPHDFALWFFRAGAHKNALQFWQSPFKSKLAENGEGFPGWHIECSAMSRKFLGPSLDIHIGGIEHVSVHHTNEIAQSEATNGVKYVNYWLHNEHLLVNGGKMSKSEGTGYSLDEVREKGFTPLALRFLFLQAHYRSRLNFTWEALEAAQNGLSSLNKEIKNLRLVVDADDFSAVDTDFKSEFITALEDDLNVPRALAVVFEILKSDLSPHRKLSTIFDFDRVLGLDLAKISEKKDDIPQSVLDLAEQRKIARANKDWQLSDELREKIKELGYIVEDAAEGMRIVKI